MMFAVDMLHEKYSLCKGDPVDGIPDSLMSQYLAYLRQSKVPASYHAEYLQWLRYYLDFCNKYSVPDSKAERVRLFCLKLKDKDQTSQQQQRAANALSLYFSMVKHGGSEGISLALVVDESLMAASSSVSPSNT